MGGNKGLFVHDMQKGESSSLFMDGGYLNEKQRHFEKGIFDVIA